MQNAKCRMQNDGVGFADDLKIIAAGDTEILNFEL